MAPKGSKQADRTAGKKAKNQPEDDDATSGGQSSGRFVELIKGLVMGSAIIEVAPTLPALVKDGIATVKGEKKAEKPKADEKEKDEADKDEQPKEDEQDGNEKEKVPDHVLDNDVCAVFRKLCLRLHWSNPLGLASPASGEESMKTWLTFKSLEIDFGPRAKRKGSPALDRITTNLYNNLPQYLHIYLLLMVVRAFLFRSFFAFLPWMVAYQCLSVFLPLDVLPSLPQIPLAKVPVEFRVAAIVGFNGLLQFFFLFELVWKSFFFEKFLLIGFVVYHSYAVRPVES